MLEPELDPELVHRVRPVLGSYRQVVVERDPPPELEPELLEPVPIPGPMGVKLETLGAPNESTTAPIGASMICTIATSHSATNAAPR